jgi:hypothetical protein
MCGAYCFDAIGSYKVNSKRVLGARQPVLGLGVASPLIRPLPAYRLSLAKALAMAELGAGVLSR